MKNRVSERRAGATTPIFRGRLVHWAIHRRGVGVAISRRIGGPPTRSCFVPSPRLTCRMTDAQQLTPAKPDDIAEAIAFALRYSGRKRVNDAGEMMARIVAERLVEALDRAGFVIMQRPPMAGGAAIGFGARDPKPTR